MYNLYVDKSETKIEIKPLRKVFHNHIGSITDEVSQYNSVYYFCAKKKPLLDLATRIKEEWLKEAEERVNTIKKITIK